MHTLSNLIEFKKLLEYIYQYDLLTVLFDGSTNSDCIHKHIYTKINYVIIPFFGIENENYKISNDNKFLFGMKYFLLKNELINQVTQNKIQKKFDVLITLGGSDPLNMTIKVIKSLFGTKYKIKIIVTKNFEKKQVKEIKVLCNKNPNLFLLENVKDIFNLISESKLVVTSTGLTKYECVVLEKQCLLVSNNNKLKIYHNKLEKYSNIKYCRCCRHYRNRKYRSISRYGSYRSTISMPFSCRCSVGGSNITL